MAAARVRRRDNDTIKRAARRNGNFVRRRGSEGRFGERGLVLLRDGRGGKGEIVARQNACGDLGEADPAHPGAHPG